MLLRPSGTTDKKQSLSTAKGTVHLHSAYHQFFCTIMRIKITATTQPPREQISTLLKPKASALPARSTLVLASFVQGMARHLLRPLLCFTVVVVVTAAAGSVDFRAELNHPYASSSLSSEEFIGHAASYLSSVLSFHLTAPPDLIRARAVKVGVFCAYLSNRNVVNLLLVQGHLEFHHQVFRLHASEAQAAAMARTLREEDPPINAKPLSVPNTRATRGHADHTPATRAAPRIRRDSAFTPNAAPGLLPQPRHDSTSPIGTERRVPVTSFCPPAFTPPPTLAGQPYLQAALTVTPSLTSPTPPPPPPIPLRHQRCHRCLARDHRVRDCRDPIRCRLCRGSGHRGYACPMVFPRELTPHPRRRPTIPLPASRVPRTRVLANKPLRHSARLAAKDDGVYQNATAKATQLKSLQNSLALCSVAVQTHVVKKKLLTKTKKPIANIDLVKLADVAGLGDAAIKALDQVLTIGAATAHQLDSALAGPDA
ncbi:hypothetical protein SETIT_6G178700v2 [Setaria italica]|uniref:CCHC-type domain-containing protein n=3 Tax=Setaria italica TaxID=4555 RepID=A0A368RMN7_SETIT|nr:hypothetical protein SETIT_6G178700v2 [Setaria italica]